MPYTYTDPSRRSSALAGLYDEDDPIAPTPITEAIEAIWGDDPVVDPTVPGSSFVSNGGSTQSGQTARLPGTGTGVNWQAAQPQGTTGTTSTATDYLPWVLGIGVGLIALYFMVDSK